MSIQKHILYFLFFCFSVAPATSQAVLENYIQQGRESNLTLQKKQLEYQKSMLALEKARGMFLPTLAFQARYTVADGGRTIDFPLGDLLNPVYSTLNQLTQGYPPANQFPDIRVENQEFYFLRPTEHETKINAVQPVFNPAIYYNYKINRLLVDLNGFDEKAYENYLICEIRTAYFNYLKTLEMESIYQYTKKTAEEHLKTNQSLVSNGKITNDNVLLAEAEIAKVEHKLSEVAEQTNKAWAYFNFLLNKPLSSEILIDSIYLQPPAPSHRFRKTNDITTSERPELKMLDVSVDIQHLRTKMQQANLLPTITLVADYGFQGEQYRFNSNYDYTLASLVLRWEFFSGGQKKAEIQKANIEKKQAELKRKETEQKLNLEATQMIHAIESVEKQLIALDKELQALDKAFLMVSKKYTQGQTSLLEYTHAKTQLESVKERKTIAWYDYLIKLSELQRVTAIYSSLLE